MKKLLNTVLKIINIIIITVMILIVLVNLYTIGAKKIKGVKIPTVCGYAYAAVLSGSMSEAVNVDDVVITKKMDSYKTGDIIMFDTAGQIVTHRIVKETDEGYITKGDANNAEDNWIVEDKDITGRVVKVVPGFGKVIQFFKEPFGMLILTLVAAAIIMIPSMINRED